MGTQETNIYRLLVRNQCFGDQFQISIFWALIGGKMGVAATPAPKGLGPKNLTKKLGSLEEHRLYAARRTGCTTLGIQFFLAYSCIYVKKGFLTHPLIYPDP